MIEHLREYLYNWHEELYTEHFTNQDVLDTFKEVTDMAISEVSEYHLNSERWHNDFVEAYHIYREVRKNGKNTRNSNR